MPESEVLRRTVRTGWVEDLGKAGARSSLVAREFNTYKRDVIQNTLLLSVPRSLGSHAAASVSLDDGPDTCIAVWGCSVALFHTTIPVPVDGWGVRQFTPPGVCQGHFIAKKRTADPWRKMEHIDNMNTHVALMEVPGTKLPKRTAGTLEVRFYFYFLPLGSFPGRNTEN